MRRLFIFIRNIFSIPYRIIFTHISPFAALQDSTVDKKAAICKGTRFYRSSIGKYSYVGNNSFVTNSLIGNFTSIAGGCYIGGTAHPLNWVSTSPVFHKWKNLFKKNFSRFEFNIFKETKIGNDVWIGEGVYIKAGVTIGDGAVIGMASVVTKDIPPYEVWAGNPAKMIRKRLDDEIIDEMLKIKWWNWNDEKIEEYSSSFNSPDDFIQQININ